MADIGEFELIDRYFKRSPRDDAVTVGIGDDGAVVNVDGAVVVAVDTLVSGIHFPVELEPAAVGHRALAVNLSDVAAMGAEPRWATLALTLPAADGNWLEPFARGFMALAERFDVELIGGDTTRGPLAVTVQVLGLLAGDRAPLLRSGGCVGDDVYVSGTLGDAAAGIALLADDDPERRRPHAELARRFAYPEPRVALGRALTAWAHAAIDISDGLIADLGHICEQSACGADLNVEDLPLSNALTAYCSVDRAREFALTGGDDYELCFTAQPHASAELARIADTTGVAITRIGRLTSERGVVCRFAGEPVPTPAGGFRHF